MPDALFAAATADEKPTMHYTIGLDMGAATTRIAMLDPTKPMPVIIRNELSNEATHTVVSYPSEEARCFGENAASRQISKATETIVDLAPWLFGSSSVDRSDANDTSVAGTAALETRTIGGKETHVAQVAAFFIKSVLRFVPNGAALEAPVCMSIPARASAKAILALRQACALAGIRKENTLIVRSEEAVAAYFHHLQYAQLDETKPTQVTIVDMGQSRSSVTVLRVSKLVVEKVGVHSINMGGGLIDGALCSYVYGEIERVHGDCGIRGDIKVFRKVLRECRKAKETLSTTDETRVQLEGLKGDIDIQVPISRAHLERVSVPLVEGLREMLTEAKKLLQPLEDGTEQRVEVVGGSWRTTCLCELIKGVMHTSRVGVCLDPNLAVAEGSAILAELCTPGRVKDEPGSKSARHPVHDVSLVNFEATDPSGELTQAFSTDEEAALVEWAILETKMAETDAAIQARLAAVNQLDSLVLQTLDVVERCTGDADRRAALRSYLSSVDDYVRDNCEGSATEAIYATIEKTKSYIADNFPEVEAYYEKQRLEELRKEEELSQMAQQQQKEDKDLKSDPQRLRMAQVRREQGQVLFKEECWKEAQVRFVQALSILGELYDTENAEHKLKKEEISLSCYLNIASCSVKLGFWKNAIHNSTRALELSPNHAKALFRRGQAHLAVKDYEAAVADLEKARELANNDPAVAADLARAKQSMEAENKRQKKMFAKMFS